MLKIKRFSQIMLSRIIYQVKTFVFKFAKTLTLLALWEYFKLTFQVENKKLSNTFTLHVKPFNLLSGVKKL